MQINHLFWTVRVVILRKLHVTVKSFAPPFFNHFSLSLNRKKHVVKRAMRKKLNIFTLQIYYIMYYNRKSPLVQMRTLLKRSERNRLSLLQRGGCNIYCFSKIPERVGHQAFMGICPTISTRLSLIYLLDEFFFLFLVQLNEWRRLGESKVLSFYFWC